MGESKCVVKLVVQIDPSDILFNQVDNTLSLLCASASSRGLPHDVTRNLASLQRRHNHWATDKYNRPSQAWNPSLPLTEYREPKKLKKRAGDNSKLDEQAWNALGDVVRMAEGRDGLTLGRVNWKDKQRTRWR